MQIQDLITDLNARYRSYMLGLKAVLDVGEGNVSALVHALDNKFASPVAKALGLMMHTDAAIKFGVPALLDWLVVQSPMYPEVFEALRRAGDLVEPELTARLRQYLTSSDDEAVRNLLDLASRLSDPAVTRILPIIEEYARSNNEHFREAAMDAVWRIGLPVGKLLEATVRQISLNDSVNQVRLSATDALRRIGSVAL